MSLLRLGRLVGNLETWVRSSFQEIENVVNGRLSPSENFLQFVEEGTTPAVAGTEFTITHGLKKGRPVTINGVLVPGIEFTYWLNGPGTLYASNLASWTDDAIKLKCTDASRDYTIIIR